MRDRPRVRVRAGDAADRELRARAVAHLAARPVENNVPLTLLDPPGGATRVAVVSSDAHPIGAAVGSPDGRLVLSAMPAAAARALAQAWVGWQAVLPGVSGPAEAARAFAAAWEQVSGQAARLAMSQQLFRLDVVEPRGVPGRARRASRDDLEVLLTWSTAFDAETGVGDAEVRANAIRRVAGGAVWLWEVSGTAVAMVARGPVLAGVTRVGHVYTPPECRRRGYAGALVATVSGEALSGGARSCTLFTDEANPTSNRIYRSIGYRPVGPALLYRFGDPATG